MSDVFYSDPNSDAAKFQAKQRWHRVNLKDIQPVVIVDLLTGEDIDAQIKQQLERKRDFYNETLGVPWKPSDETNNKQS